MTMGSKERQFIEDIFGWNTYDNIIDWIQRNLNPDDVFGEDQLMDWAEDNGYTHE